MIESNQKEQFSLAFVRAVAATAGFKIRKEEVDDDSIDIEICASYSEEFSQCPQLTVQLKCTGREILNATEVSYPISIKNYNDLRRKTHVPRILVVMRVPKNIQEWLEHSEEKTIIQHCCYWESLLGKDEIPNQDTVTVSFPRNQMFNPTSLKEIMRKINNDQPL